MRKKDTINDFIATMTISENGKPVLNETKKYNNSVIDDTFYRFFQDKVK